MRLWYFRNRRYLTGIDWVVGSLHESAKKVNGCGAISQAILELNGRLEEGPVRNALDEIGARFPILFGNYARDWLNLAPYWKVPGGGGKSIALRVVDLPADAKEEADRLLVEHVNTPLLNDRQHLRFLLIRLGDRQSRLGLLFDHRLFDAFGAEMFFRLMEETFNGRLEEAGSKIRVTEPAHLDKWKGRFDSGQKLNRVMIELQKKQVCALAKPRGGGKICFVHSALTAEESVAINKLAFAEISVPILLPSAAARAVEAVREGMGSAGALSGEQYLMFTSANMRAAGQEWESIFFNHFSFVLFSSPAEKKSLKETAVGLRDQFFTAMKEKLPFALQDAAMLGRIFPRWLVARVTNSLFGGRMCSFYFACLKDCGFGGSSFMGMEVGNLIHTPLAFSPPGMNLCMTYYGGRFNLVFAYLEGVMEREVAGRVLGRFRESLVGT